MNELHGIGIHDNNYELFVTNLPIIFDSQIGFSQFKMLSILILNSYNFVVHIESKFGKTILCLQQS